MQNVSGEYKNLIYAPSRKISAKVEFDMIDEDTIRDATVVPLVAESVVSRSAQVLNGKRLIHDNYATFEPYRFKLDGSMKIPPRANQGNYEIGFWSEAVCDNNGIFDQDQILVLDFTKPHNALDITITFDLTGNEGPKQFFLETYNGTTKLKEYNIRNQSANPVFRLFEPLENFDRIIITIITWFVGNRRARITEIDLGVLYEFEGKDLINLNVIEEMDLVGSTVPSNELRFTIDNQDRRFNILNPEGIYQYIKKNQQVRAYLGLEIDEGQENYEFVPIGIYYLSEWQSDEGALTTSFVARDIFDRLEVIEYNSTLFFPTLYDLAEDILLSAGVISYRIDDKLKNDDTMGYTEPLNAREALQNVAIAGRAIIYQNREGTVVIERIEPLTTSTGFITFPSEDTYAGYLTIPEVSNDYEFQAIDFGNTFAEPQIKLNEPIEALIFSVRTGTDTFEEATFTNPENIAGSTYKIENPLINTTLHAERVASWMFTEYNLRGHYTANWRQNPALEVKDSVMIEDSFGQKKKARIVKQEYQFEGFLTGNTEAIGGV